jgi:hypothetical protein
VFQPTEEAKKGMNLLMLILGVFFQNTNYQLALLHDLSVEAQILMRNMEKLKNVYYEMSSINTNYELGYPLWVQPFSIAQLHNRFWTWD